MLGVVADDAAADIVPALRVGLKKRGRGSPTAGSERRTPPIRRRSPLESVTRFFVDAPFQPGIRGSSLFLVDGMLRAKRCAVRLLRFWFAEAIGATRDAAQHQNIIGNIS